VISDARNFVITAQAISTELARQLGPPEEGVRSTSQEIIPFSIVRGTRGYIERVVNQANGAYSQGWYDAAAVMIRRLLETLIIEAFEKHGIDSKIKNTNGDFFYLGDLISRTLAETTWNLGRNCRQALPRLKDVGDKSAHSRRFTAQRGDLQPLLADIRTVVQEFIYLAGLK
jgi:hypothetical protein